MSNFFIQNKVTNKIIEQISEKMFCEVYPKNPRKPNGIAQRYSPDYSSDMAPDREPSGAPKVIESTSITDIEAAVTHVSGQNGSLGAVPDQLLAETIVQDIANGSGRFETISDQAGMLKVRDTSNGIVYGLKRYDGNDTVADSGRVEILASRVAEEFGFAQGRIRVASDLGENGSFAVLIEMPDSVVAGD